MRAILSGGLNQRLVSSCYQLVQLEANGNYLLLASLHTLVALPAEDPARRNLFQVCPLLQALRCVSQDSTGQDVEMMVIVVLSRAVYAVHIQASVLRYRCRAFSLKFDASEIRVGFLDPCMIVVAVGAYRLSHLHRIARFHWILKASMCKDIIDADLVDISAFERV